ncbi:hypothetical protein DFJ43DRAFT_1039746 [Lentinula guzmanii]|uniref:Uncharacterized protein n=1 Tax=Lentinula guzmanii TaxID=2804957 RepID=A0AA38N0F6_9AGAR|nr:hypothetical protein DFJ43DRAFT_1039746 [Lentinula guzmanii]
MSSDTRLASKSSLENPSIPNPPKSRPYTIPPLTLPTVDLLSDVVHESAQTIAWPCGWETVLPTAIQDGVNVLEPDAERVRWMADSRNAIPSEHSNVKYLDKAAYGKKNKGALINDIRKLNGQNYVVVISGRVDDHGKKFESYEDVEEEYSLAVDKSLDLQYHSFIENVNNTDVIGMILDTPICKQGLPEPYNQMDDSAIAVQQMKSSQSAKLVGLNLVIHLQHLLSPTWACFTMQDADGFSVAGQVLGDRNDPQPKMWALISFKDPSVAAQAHEKITQTILDLYANITHMSWGDEFAKLCLDHKVCLHGWPDVKHVPGVPGENGLKEASALPVPSGRKILKVRIRFWQSLSAEEVVDEEEPLLEDDLVRFVPWDDEIRSYALQDLVDIPIVRDVPDLDNEEGRPLCLLKQSGGTLDLVPPPPTNIPTLKSKE